MDSYEELLRYIFGDRVPGEGVRPYEGRVQPIVLKDGRILSLKSVLKEMLDVLPWKKGTKEIERWQRYKMVLVLRFGLEDVEKQSLTEASHKLGMSGTWVRELQNQARALLRHPTCSQHLVVFMPDFNLPPSQEKYPDEV